MLQKLLYAIFYFFFSVFLIFWITATFFLTPITNFALKDFELEVKDGGTIIFDPVQIALDIRDFSLVHNKTELVHFKHLIVDIAAFPLLKGDIAFHKVYLEGLDSKVRLEQENVFLNEVDVLALFDSKKATPELAADDAPIANVKDTEQTQELSKDAQAKPLNIAIKKLQLKSIHVEFSQPELATTIDVENFNLNKFSFDGSELSAQTDLQSTIQLTVDNPDNPIDLKTDITLDTKVLLTLGTVLDVDVDGFDFALSNTAVAAAGYQIDNQNFHIDSKTIQVQLENNAPKSIAAELSVSQQSLVIRPLAQLETTLSLASLTLKDIVLSNDKTQLVFTPEVSVEQLVISTLVAMQGAEPSDPLLSLDAAEINRIIASQQNVNVDEILIGKIGMNATMSKDKQLTPLFLAPAKADSDTTPVPESPTAKTSTAATSSEAVANTEKNTGTQESTDKTEVAAATEKQTESKVLPNIRVGKVTLLEPTDAKFRDFSVKPAFNTHLKVNTLNLTEINSLAPQQITKFELSAQLDEYTKIAANADLQPFLPKPQYKGKVTVDELSLPELSPYVSSALGYNIESGQLDSKVSVKVDGTALSGKSLTHLKSMELNAIEESGEKNNLSGGAISFNAALGMLKDGDDVVELDIPIKGDLNKPSVGLSGIMSLVIKQATMSAAKDYLITSFLPYAKVVKIAMSASDHLLKIRFEPLIYRPDDIQVQDEQLEYISQLAAALKQNPDINIKLCPVATPAELGSEFNKDDRIQLAQKRGVALKTLLINNYAITSKRLYSCSAKIDADDDAKPRIDIDQL
ncbi:DUF748 domain-containing protein [Psychrosphaera sp. B3R10]|uniref:DUF748 domain-containing protein n=1 Tax=unclassified Psychrosphaera TaxID=2641570 RepID=UPI001C094975|nr:MULTISPECIES: DUF748 domain-containing protein [unclassified Psychrosphaera]MBU2883821.1 DUF748 domain-containing protein [Psychrosphaera sp. I2R16]MBU2989669.1 DUF748 domain-containing protein [Psychrosphaera sp. B3R10]